MTRSQQAVAWAKTLAEQVQQVVVYQSGRKGILSKNQLSTDELQVLAACTDEMPLWDAALIAVEVFEALFKGKQIELYGRPLERCLRTLADKGDPITAEIYALAAEGVANDNDIQLVSGELAQSFDRIYQLLNGEF